MRDHEDVIFWMWVVGVVVVGVCLILDVIADIAACGG